MRAIATLLTMSLLATGLAGCAAPDEPDGPGPDRQAPGAIDFQTLDQGQSSAIEQQRTVLVTDQTAWSQLWAEHIANRGGSGDERPQVDFETQRVAAAFRGQAPNACHGAEVETVRYDQANATVQVEVAWVEVTGLACAEVLTYPYHIVVFNATAEEAVFATRDVQRSDEDGGGSGPEGSKVPTARLNTSGARGLEDRGERVVRDQTAWQELWEAMTRHDSDPDPPPQVDFSERMVLAVFKGQSPDGCHGAAITSVTEVDNGSYVVQGVYSKVTGTSCTLAITYPFDLVTVPTSQQQVLFQMTEETRQHDESETRAKVPFETLEQGGQSGISQRSEVVVRDNETWQALWANHTSDQSDPGPAPEVNFSERMVVAVFKGESSNACHRAVIDRVLVTGDDRWRVEGRYHVEKDAMCAQVISHPFHMVELDRHGGEVVFEME